MRGARSCETTGGRVSGAMTEHGRIDCGAVVLAGGVQSRLLSRSANLGVDFLQLKVLGFLVMRTAPGFSRRARILGGWFEFRLSQASRRRLHRGAAQRQRHAALTPGPLSGCCSIFCRRLTREWRQLRLRVGRPLPSRNGTFRDAGRSTPLRRSKPFACSIPPPKDPILDEGKSNLGAGFSSLRYRPHRRAMGRD